MSIFTVFLVALGLSMDAMAVAASNSMAAPRLKHKKIVIIAAAFGIMQGVMPVAGFLAGSVFVRRIENVQHFAALALLGGIGIKMILEAVKSMRNPDVVAVKQDIPFGTIALQAVATSIDALVTGISFRSYGVNIAASAGVIAVTTFVCCYLGGYAGKKAGGLFREYAEIAGGVILIGIGIKIFLAGV